LQTFENVFHICFPNSLLNASQNTGHENTFDLLVKFYERKGKSGATLWHYSVFHMLFFQDCKLGKVPD
jgi:hypothetical protein